MIGKAKTAVLLVFKLQQRREIKNTQIHPVSFISEYTLFQPTQMSIADLDNYLNTLKEEPEIID